MRVDQYGAEAWATSSWDPDAGCQTRNARAIRQHFTEASQATDAEFAIATRLRPARRKAGTTDVESARMHDLDLLVPSALVDPGISTDLLRDRAMPHLARVLAFGHRAPDLVVPSQASLTPWQAWVFGGPDGSASERVNLGELWAMACGIAPASAGGRYVVEPAHFKVANDHLRLDDPAGLAITLAEARALAAVVEPVLRDAGWRLDPIEPATLTHWLATRDDGAALSAAAIEKAIGDNIADWQPRMPEQAATTAGDAALAWRRCVNEIQMLWFGHPVNEAREARGQPTVNTLWLSGNGRASDEQPALPRYASVVSALPLLAALPIEAGAPRMLESFDRFIEPARREDWSSWRSELESLDARLGAALRQQVDGAVGALTLVLCGRDRATATTIVPKDRRRVWRGWFGKPAPLDGVFADGVLEGAA